jgi:hypothetical protein
MCHHDFWRLCRDTARSNYPALFLRGAYCAAVTISLLNLPLDLPSDSPACAAGHTGLFSGLGEWIRRCESPSWAPLFRARDASRHSPSEKPRHTKGVCPPSQDSRPTVHMRFALWDVYLSLIPHIAASQGMLPPASLPAGGGDCVKWSRSMHD